MGTDNMRRSWYEMESTAIDAQAARLHAALGARPVGIQREPRAFGDLRFLLTDHVGGGPAPKWWSTCANTGTN